MYNRCRFRNRTTPPYTYAEYEESDLHKPIWTNANLPPELNSADLDGTYTDLTPRKGRELSEMELPINMMRLFGQAATYQMPRFLEITYSGSVIYGWIDSVDTIASKGPNVNTLIRWHVDYWLTAQRMNHRISLQSLSKQPVTLGQGRVKRGLEASARPDPSNPRRWVTKDVKSLSEGKWVLIYYHAQSGNNYIVTYEMNGTITNHNRSFTTTETYNNTVLDTINIDPDDVFGIWAVPWRIGTAYSIQDGVTPDGQNVSWYYGDPTSTAVRSFPLTETTNDDHIKTVITDFYGNAAATLPWGMHYNYYSETIDIGTSGCNLIIRFAYVPPSPDPTVVYPPVEGGVVTISCPSIPLFSNALSSYILSGQYKYDRDTADYARQQAAYSGIANVGQSILSGAVAGTIAAPGIGTVAGAVGGAVASLMGTVTDYAVGTTFDEKSLQATYKLMADQATNAIIGAGGPKWLLGSDCYAVVRMERDSVSEAELSTEQTELGFITDYYETDCQTLILNGGGFRIEGVQVKGDILPEGRAYIQALFARGVHIDLIG